MAGETADKIGVNWLSVKKKDQNSIKQRHNLVEHNTEWGTQKDSALWIKAERCPKLD